MGAGASAGLQKTISEATAEELQVAVGCLPFEQLQKLKAAFAEAPAKDSKDAEDSEDAEDTEDAATKAARKAEKRAMAIKPGDLKDGDEVYIPISRTYAKLLLQGTSFSYVPNSKARFSEGAQGTYITECGDEPKVILYPTKFGPHCDGGEDDIGKPITVALGAEPLIKDCPPCTLPADAKGGWMDPDYEE